MRRVKPDQLRVGDLVLVKRKGIYPLPNAGRQGKVVGFEETAIRRRKSYIFDSRKPGIYANVHRLVVQFEHGKAVYSAGNLILIQPAIGAPVPTFAWLRPLPDTPFWEGDLVRLLPSSSKARVAPEIVDKLQVVSFIDYLGYDPHFPGLIYGIQGDGDEEWSLPERFTAEELELVERGNVWRYYHRRKLKLKNAIEEGEFLLSIGRGYVEVPNPAAKRGMWSYPQGPRALREGLIHALADYEGILHRTGPSRYGICFTDLDFGEQVRLELLAKKV